MTPRLLAAKLASLHTGDTFSLMGDEYEITSTAPSGYVYACNLSDDGHDLRLTVSHTGSAEGTVEIEEVAYDTGGDA